MENRTGGIAQNTYWRSAAHSHSEDSIGTGNHAKERKKKQKQNPISPQRGRNGRVRDFADTEHTKKNTKRIKETWLWSMLYRAGKGGIQTVAEDKVYHLGQ